MWARTQWNIRAGLDTVPDGVGWMMLGCCWSSGLWMMDEPAASVQLHKRNSNKSDRLEDDRIFYLFLFSSFLQQFYLFLAIYFVSFLFTIKQMTSPLVSCCQLLLAPRLSRVGGSSGTVELVGLCVCVYIYVAFFFFFSPLFLCSSCNSINTKVRERMLSKPAGGWKEEKIWWNKAKFSLVSLLWPTLENDRPGNDPGRYLTMVPNGQIVGSCTRHGRFFFFFSTSHISLQKKRAGPLFFSIVRSRALKSTWIKKQPGAN